VMEEAAFNSMQNFNRRVEEGGLEGWIRAYLRTGHRDRPEAGCVVATLAAELARHPKSSRKPFTDRLAQVRSSIEEHLPAGMEPPRKKKIAIGVFSILVGALQMARAVNDPMLSDEILEAGIASALELAQIKPAIC